MDDENKVQLTTTRAALTSKESHGYPPELDGSQPDDSIARPPGAPIEADRSIPLLGGLRNTSPEAFASFAGTVNDIVQSDFQGTRSARVRIGS